MNWNWDYRIVKVLADGGYTLRLVWYEADGRPSKCGSASIDHVSFDSPEDIRAELDAMKEALDKPVLDAREIGGVK